ncbi:tRNA pseudouridine(55) synthase TruB [Candidatus Cytomitobacter indipagum]|uniref:tRNA pseudouridine synthase B n=1 Tax=Candidatus Cytomitobacter indipagum TaxID=2601575 RepID=A0A5C0UFZ1_9PROT|nr:tRNA pseudouridine(55) synthase TruB [Candidatus Cytomitobacter indipagum]QEK38182.1 tRNA pseudouridine(55) synthase TruB [Candidatus Cytomitobacter indipagum]
MDNGVLILNKPRGCTSMDLIRKSKRELNIKKVGHAGTLDPMADGILPILIGEATKFTTLFHDQTKKYTFSVEFGKHTDSYDEEGSVIDETDVIPSKSMILEMIPNFLGKIMQVPPKFSACKVDGRRAYDLARKNVDFELNAKQVEIKSLVLDEFNAPFATFSTECTSGTYIRSLAVDIAKNLNSLCYVKSLTRTHYWYFSEDSEGKIIDLKDVQWESKIDLSSEQYDNLKHGRTVNYTHYDGEVVGLYQGDVIGILEMREGILYPKRMLKYA